MEKPKRPEGYLECGLCHYRDKISTYKHTCYFGILLGILLMCFPLGVIIMLAIKILN